MKKVISVLIAVLFAISVVGLSDTTVMAQDDGGEQVRLEIEKHKQAIRRLKAELRGSRKEASIDEGAYEEEYYGEEGYESGYGKKPRPGLKKPLPGKRKALGKKKPHPGKAKTIGKRKPLPGKGKALGRKGAAPGKGKAKAKAKGGRRGGRR